MDTKPISREEGSLDGCATRSSLDRVLQHPAIWRGDSCARVALPSVPTGYAELDAWLPGGGWPAGALTEIHVERAGVGELQLVMPAAARITRSGRWLAIVGPPYVPYAPALAAHGVNLSRLLLVATTATEDGLWACEQALRSQTCGAALAWFDWAHERALRRLQLAAESGGASLLLFRPPRPAGASPAALKIHVSKSQSRTLVRILKRRGGGLPAPIALDLHPKAGHKDRGEHKENLNRLGVTNAVKNLRENFPNSPLPESCVSFIPH